MGTYAQRGQTVAQETDLQGESCLDGGVPRLGAVAFLSSSPSESDPQGPNAWILCSYRNGTNRMVIVRAKGADAFFLERVVFPFEIMTFHCPRDGEVEVSMHTSMGVERRESIAPHHLLAAAPGVEALADWRPQRCLRSVSVRSNASTTCREGV